MMKLKKVYYWHLAEVQHAQRCRQNQPARQRLRALPKSATSDRKLAALQPPRTVPSSASVRRKTAVKIAAEEQIENTTQHLILAENAAVSPDFAFALHIK